MVRQREKKSDFVRAQENLAKERKKELRTVTSTQTYNPIADVKDGIIITTDGRFIKIIPVIPCNFQLQSPSEQNKIISSFASTLRLMILTSLPPFRHLNNPNATPVLPVRCLSSSMTFADTGAD